MKYIKPKVRPATRDDLVACVVLFDSPEFYDANGEKWSEEGLSRYLDDYYFLVAEVNGNIVGSIVGERLRDKGVIVHLLVVDPNYRDMNIGSAIMQKFERNARAKKNQWVILYSDLHNSKTLKFYEKNGYHAGQKFVECLKIL